METRMLVKRIEPMMAPHDGAENLQLGRKYPEHAFSETKRTKYSRFVVSERNTVSRGVNAFTLLRRVIPLLPPKDVSAGRDMGYEARKVD
jgi:hypothetical protein